MVEHNFSDIQQKIKIVTEDILNRFPGCCYTIRMLLWNDGTNRIECRHGTCDRLHISSYYNNELTYEEFELRRGDSMLVDEFGNEYYKK